METPIPSYGPLTREASAVRWCSGQSYRPLEPKTEVRILPGLLNPKPPRKRGGRDSTRDGCHSRPRVPRREAGSWRGQAPSARAETRQKPGGIPEQSSGTPHHAGDHSPAACPTIWVSVPSIPLKASPPDQQSSRNPCRSAGTAGGQHTVRYSAVVQRKVLPPSGPEMGR